MTTTISAKTRKKSLKSNLNGKLNCPYFCHIELARDSGITESVAETTVFEFSTQDASYHTVHAQLIDSVRQPLQDLAVYFIWLSHGMDKKDFIKKVLTEVKGATLLTEMVVYFYKSE